MPLSGISPYMTRFESVSDRTIIDKLRGRKSYVPSTEVMEILNVTRQTLCGWVRSGTISAVRIGKSNMFDPGTLAGWLEARQL